MELFINRLLEANNQLLMNHITGLSIFITILIVFFTIIAFYIPIRLYKSKNEIDKKIKKLEEIQNDAIFLMQNCYVAIGDFYSRELKKSIDTFYNNSQNVTEAQKIVSLLDNIFLSIYTAKNKDLAISAIQDIKNQLKDVIKEPVLKELLLKSLVENKFKYNKNWKIFFGEDKEKYNLFYNTFLEIYEIELRN